MPRRPLSSKNIHRSPFPPSPGHPTTTSSLPPPSPLPLVPRPPCSCRRATQPQSPPPAPLSLSSGTHHTGSPRSPLLFLSRPSPLVGSPFPSCTAYPALVAPLPSIFVGPLLPSPTPAALPLPMTAPVPSIFPTILHLTQPSPPSPSSPSPSNNHPWTALPRHLPLFSLSVRATSISDEACGRRPAALPTGIILLPHQFHEYALPVLYPTDVILLPHEF